jgi:hypothetical protein
MAGLVIRRAKYEVKGPGMGAGAIYDSLRPQLFVDVWAVNLDRRRCVFRLPHLGHLGRAVSTWLMVYTASNTFLQSLHLYS